MKGMTTLNPLTSLVRVTSGDKMEKAKFYLALFLMVLATANFGLDFWPLAVEPPSPFLPGLGFSMSFGVLSVISGLVVIVCLRDQSDEGVVTKMCDAKTWVSLFFSVLNVALGVLTLVFQLYPMHQCWLAPPVKDSCCPETHSQLGIALAASVCATVIIFLLQIFVIVIILREIISRFLSMRDSGNLIEEQSSLFWKSSKDADALSARSGVMAV